MADAGTLLPTRCCPRPPWAGNALGRTGQIGGAWIAAARMSLASADADHITAQAIGVNGGAAV